MGFSHFQMLHSIASWPGQNCQRDGLAELSEGAKRDHAGLPSVSIPQYHCHQIVAVRSAERSPVHVPELSDLLAR